TRESSRRAWKASPTSFPASCRARSTKNCSRARRRSNAVAKELTPMGMSVGAKGLGGGRRRRGGRRHGAISEINVTPLVDVMLVLLITFMVAAPMMTVGVPIHLPETQAKAMKADTQPITISVNPAGEIYLQESAIAIDEV